MQKAYSLQELFHLLETVLQTFDVSKAGVSHIRRTTHMTYPFGGPRFCASRFRTAERVLDQDHRRRAQQTLAAST